MHGFSSSFDDILKKKGKKKKISPMFLPLSSHLLLPQARKQERKGKYSPVLLLPFSHKDTVGKSGRSAAASALCAYK